LSPGKSTCFSPVLLPSPGAASVTRSRSCINTGARCVPFSGPRPSTRALVHRGEPVAIAGRVASDRLAVSLLQLCRHSADAAVADLVTVDLGHGQDLHSGAAKQQLVTVIELVGIDAALGDPDPQLPGDQLQQRVARDAVEDA